MDILYIVMPVYNEASNIEEVVNEWYKVIEEHDGGGKSRLVIFNDGSTDLTAGICKVLEEKLPMFTLIDKENSGHGPTLIQAYEYAIKSGADYVFQTDSDGQTDPVEFEKFWDERRLYDGIFGVRRHRGDGFARLMVERVLCSILHYYFDVDIPDANAPFRLMKANILKKYMDMLPENYNLPNAMLTTYFVHFEEKVCFKEISFENRKGGVNSINLKKIVKIGINALFDFKRLKKAYF